MLNEINTILITGGAGFVGSSLALRFKNDLPKLRVVALDNLKRKGSELNLNRLRQSGVEFFHGDVRNAEDLVNVGEFQLLIECSAEPSVLAGYNESPAYLINTNLIGTINCLEQVRKYKARIIFLSTSRVYPIALLNSIKLDGNETRFVLGLSQTLKGLTLKGISEEFPLTGYRSLYGATKLASELLLQEYIQAYGIQGVINRCGVIAGPWQMGKIDQGVAVLWAARHIYNQKLSYIGYGGEGKQVRDVLHVDDLYHLLNLQLAQLNLCNGQVYNVGGGDSISFSLLELTNLVQELSGNCIKIAQVHETRTADIPFYITDTSKLRDQLNWTPKIQLREIMYEIVEWISNNKQELKSILG